MAARKIKKRLTKRPAKTGRKANPQPAQLPTSAPLPEAVQQHFVSGVLTRGEAAVAEGGELPPGVTHEIVGKTATGTPVLRRRRFSTF